jgi:hypothetical protein
MAMPIDVRITEANTPPINGDQGGTRAATMLSRTARPPRT